MKKIHILIPSLLAMTNLPIISLVACNQQPPEANNFETDPWSTVCYYANKGFSALQKAYGHGSFLGTTRTVNINGVVHNVTVIGENSDTLANSQNKAPLTFQFETVISADDKIGLGIQYEYEQPTTCFWDAEINQALNDTQASDLHWKKISGANGFVYQDKCVLEMIQDQDLLSNIKTVVRKAHEYSIPSSSYTPKTKKC